MLMFVMHIAIGVSIIALIMALGFVKCCKEKCGEGEGKHSACGKFCGWILVIIATLSLLCTLYSGFVAWQKGDVQVNIMILDDMTDGDSNQ